MTTHSATSEPGKVWWMIGASAAVIGAAGVGWSLADLAGAAAAGCAVLMGIFAVRWATSQRAPTESGEGDRAKAGEAWGDPKIAGFYKGDSYKSDTRTALSDSGTRSGMYVVKAPRSRTGVDL
ncbi:MAG: hypothetical protein JNK25_07755 [Phycisphaerae bacterium]|nr:hypothetical protein [Phycisphaerae bacterium]